MTWRQKHIRNAHIEINRQRRTMAWLGIWAALSAFGAGYCLAAIIH